MTRSRAPYMEWAKSRPAPDVDLAGSNLLACTLDDLPGAREALDLSGESPNGYPPLVSAIAAHAGVSPDRVATAGGCSGANFLAFAALVDAGDEVLLEWPGYDPLVAAARMVGGQIRFFERRFEDAWAVDPDRVAAACTPATRLVVLSSPHNPSGVLVPEATLAALAGLAQERGIRILVDEVYLETVAGAPRRPAAALSPVFLSTNSLTKAYGLSSLRCGWALADREGAEAMRRARDVVDVNGPLPSDRLAALAFSLLPSLRERAARILGANRALWRHFALSHPQLACVPADGSIVFPRLPSGVEADEFAARLFDRRGVAVASGSFFGAPRHFRVALGGDSKTLARGLEAIGEEIARI